MARPSVGAKPPDVTLPTTLPAIAISAPSRAIALPSGSRPTRLRGAPSAICFWMTAAPGKPPCCAALLADAPQQARLDRRGRGVDVVAVEAEAGFEAQRIAGAQADRLDLGLGQQLAGDGLGGVGRRRDLVAVAAGVARARDVAARAVDHDEGAGHELQAPRPAAPAAPAPAPPADPAAPAARARTSARSRRRRRGASAGARGRRPCRRR